MNECTYKNYDELPLMLNVVQVAAVLGISRAGAYELVHSEGFPALKIGSRIVVPKDKLREWIDANTAHIVRRTDGLVAAGRAATPQAMILPPANLFTKASSPKPNPKPRKSSSRPLRRLKSWT